MGFNPKIWTYCQLCHHINLQSGLDIIDACDMIWVIVTVVHLLKVSYKLITRVELVANHDTIITFNQCSAYSLAVV